MSRVIDLSKQLSEDDVAYLAQRDDPRLAEAKLPKPKADKPKD